MLRSTALAVALTAFWLALTGTASAAYTLVPWSDCLGGFNSGSYDDAGELFVPCGAGTSTLRVFGADGNLKTFTALPFFASDAAPSPDGAYVYVTSADIVPRRLDRQPDGSYVLDPGWAPQSYSLYGARTPHGVFVDTDSLGNIYLADGAWSPNNTDTVVKYAPDGTVITRFGEYTWYGAADARSWDLGFFYWMLTGVDAVGDGSVVYTLEGGNDRVQKWTLQGNGTYKASTSYGGSAATDPNREGACSNGQAFAGTFAAPYDLGNDTAGNFYVINTTCHEVIKFDSSWNYLTDIDVGSETSPSDSWSDGSLKRPHGIAVAANGNVCIGQSHMRLQADGTPVPCNGAPTTPATTPGGGGGGGDTGGGSGAGGDANPGDGGGAGPGPPARDSRAPVVGVSARKRQRLGRARKVTLTLTCDEACTANARLTLKLGRRTFSARSHADGPGPVVIVVPRAAARALRRAGALAGVTLTATDAAGNSAAPVVRRIRLLP